jgi:3-oxoacyl-[acyl-carrier-protein] synthase II
VKREEVYITGVGIVSPIGIGREAFLAGLRSARCGLGRLERLDAVEFRIGRGGEVRELFAEVEALPPDQRAFAFALRACREAMADAGIAEVPPGATLALGSGAGEMPAMEESMGPAEESLNLHLSDPVQPPNAITSKLASALGARGRLLTFVNACAAGAQAIAVASDLVRAGRAEVAVAGGVEVLSRMVLSGFEALRAVSPTGPRPFDAGRDGIQLAEIAAFVVLESGDRLEGRRPYARISGSSASADAFHVVRPDESGSGAVLALRRALADAHLEPGDIDYVNAHGTGTAQNDPPELAALVSVFGERAATLPISSTKAMLGHALGASGAAEVIACALSLREGFLPPTIGLRQPIDGYEGFDFVPEPRERVSLRNVLSSAFAFGGNNVVVVLSKST